MGGRPLEGRRSTGTWQEWCAPIRLYGGAALMSTKTADVVTTLVGLRFGAAVVEANPVAHSIFLELGLYSGLAVLSALTVIYATVAAETLALSARDSLQKEGLALAVLLAIYGSLSVIFGIVAVHNAIIIFHVA